MRASKKPASPASRQVTKRREWFNSITFAVIAATLIRWTAVEAYVIPTPSMENSALVGDFLFVSKFHYGTRTTGTPLQIPLTHQKIWGTDIPSYVDWIQLPMYRLPGISQVKKGDVVVFNAPPLELNEGKLHPITLKNNYVKRCVALPGDIIQIKDREVYINGEPLAKPKEMKLSYIVVSAEPISEKNMRRLDLDSDDQYYLGVDDNNKAYYRMLLTEDQLAEVKDLTYIQSAEPDRTRDEGWEQDIFPSSAYSHWSGNFYGPLTIPKKGMTIAVNDSTMGVYGETIQLYEHQKNVQISNGKLVIDGKGLTEYTFDQDYYFMMGDNRNNSLDSRYWGFVPDDHIVGKALFVWMSIDQEADFFNKIRWKRLFTRIQ
jgi:signal peptidase I